MSTDLTKFVECVNFAAVKHQHQRRKDPEETPYINHPIGVSNLLVKAGVTDLVTLQAAVLHDTVEDTDTTFEEIEENFGKEVADIVREVTDDKLLPKLQRKQMQILKALKVSFKAKLVKLADKLYNLTDLERSTPIGWSEARVEEYFEWALKVVSGLRGTNAFLEQQLDELFRKRKVLEKQT